MFTEYQNAPNTQDKDTQETNPQQTLTLIVDLSSIIECVFYCGEEFLPLNEGEALILLSYHENQNGNAKPKTYHFMAEKDLYGKEK